MPDRHFYLLRHHILFYIKFLLFCSLAPDEIKILCRKNKGVSLEEFVNPLDFNFPESHILLVHSMFPNCGFSIVRKKKPYHIPDADEYLKYSDYRADGIWYYFFFRLFSSNESNSCLKSKTCEPLTGFLSFSKLFLNHWYTQKLFLFT